MPETFGLLRMQEDSAEKQDRRFREEQARQGLQNHDITIETAYTLHGLETLFEAVVQWQLSAGWRCCTCVAKTPLAQINWLLLFKPTWTSRIHRMIACLLWCSGIISPDLEGFG